MAEKDIQEKLARLSPEKRQILLQKLQESNKNGEKQQNLKAIKKQENKGFVELSYAQQRLWFLDKLEGPNPAYNMPALFRLKGDINIKALTSSIEAIVERHEMMRTVFTEIEGRAYQKIIKPFKYPIKIEDFSKKRQLEKNQLCEKLINQSLMVNFDLNNAPLFLLKLIKLSEKEAILVINMHHIISDGWSAGVLIRELSALYAGYCSGVPIKLPPLEIQYSDYSQWQREFLKGKHYKNKTEFWKKYLADIPVLELPLDKPRPAVQSTRGAREEFALTKNEILQLKRIADQAGTTIFNALLAAYLVLLYRYTGQEDIAVGVPVANRNRSEIEPLIGFFVNTVTLRQDLSADERFLELLKRVKTNVIKVFDHQDIPFEKLVDELGVARDMSQSPLFQTMFNYQEQQFDSLKMPNIELDFLATNMPIAKFDITLSFINYGERLEGEIEYNTDLFAASTIKNMLQHFKKIITGIVENPQTEISEIPMLSQNDWQWLEEKNQNTVDYQSHSAIHHQIEEQAEKTPDNLAVICGEFSVSYSKLNKRANQLAQFIQEKLQQKAHSEMAMVGICLDRSIDLIVSILAVLKAGAAYVPMDPSYPKQRLEFMVSNSGMPLVLTSSELAINVTDQTEIIQLDQITNVIENQPQLNLGKQISDQQLIYGIYTSGSTGLPKCAGTSHKAENNLLQWYCSEFNLTEKDRVLLLGAMGFDLTQKNIFAPLIKGAALVIPEQRYFELDELLKLIATANISWLNCAPSAFYPLVDNINNFKALQSLRYVFLGGEPIKHQRLRLWHEQTECQLVNTYGPTECTDIASFHRFTTKDWSSDRSAPIGKPIPNVQLYVLDRQGKLVPPGIPGELHIGGESVGSGYLRDKTLTTEKFIKLREVLKLNKLGKKLYKTGDRVRYRKDGCLDYLGRIDNQVKLRGYRIELGEIENQLNEISSVSESAVILKESPEGNYSLVGFIVRTNVSKDCDDEENSLASIKRALKEKLPDYMVPSQFVVLEVLPLTANGKIDRKSLQDLELIKEHEARENTLLPRTEKEKCLTKIWSEVLNCPQIAIDDNFFDLGGDSILSIQIVSRARRAGMGITARQIFENQTVMELAEVVEWGGNNTLAEQGIVEGPSLLNPVQKWFFEEPVAEADHWNQSVLLELDDSVAIEHIKQAIQGLIAQHDALRLTFPDNNGVIQEGLHQAVDITDIVNSYSVDNAQELSHIIAKTQASLSLQNGPLIAIAYINDDATGPAANSNKTIKLFIVIHHLVIDGVSWRILLEDLNLAIQQAISGTIINLGAKTTSFKDYALLLNEYGRSGISDETKNYWQELGNQGLPQLPFENPEGSNLVSDTSTLRVKLGADQTAQLLSEANKAYRTDTNDLLLTALVLAISDWTKGNAVLISLEGHGREEFSEKIDLSKTIGWFTTLYPLLLRLPQNSELGAVIKAVKEQKRAVHNNGFEYGLLKYSDPSDKHPSNNFSKINPQLVFNYLGQFALEENENQHFSLSELDFNNTNLSPLGKRKHIIEVNGGVTNACLDFFWSFSDKQFNQQVIQSVAENFIVQLEKIIAHCQEEKNYGLTPSDFPLCKLSQTEVDALMTAQGQYFGKRNIIDAYPLSSLQEGMIFHALHEQGTGLYCEQVKLDINEALYSEALKQAWQQAIDKHTALRTAFIWEDIPQPLQCVHENIPVLFTKYSGNINHFDSFVAEELSKGFDLNKPGLTKIYVCEKGKNKFSLAVIFHHIILDGWSLSLVLGDVFRNYKAIIDDQKKISSQTYGQSRLSKFDYRSFIEFLNDKNASDKEDEKNFWKKYLKGIDEHAELPADYSLDKLQSAERDTLSIKLNKINSEKIAENLKKERITENVFFQGVWALLLSRYSGVSDVIFGSTLAGRLAELPKSEEIVGLFINTLPVRIKIDNYEEATVAAFLSALQKQQLDLRNFETSGLNHIHKWIDYKKERELFDSLFVFENYPVDQALAEGANDLSIDAVETQWHTNYPLTLVINPGDSLEIKISYDKQRFSKIFINDMLENFVQASEVLVNNLSSSIKDLSLLSNKQRKKILGDWNNTKSDYENHATVAELFEQQVARTPKNIALRCNQQTYTYEQINIHANQLAEKISKRLAVDKNEQALVAICAERSVEMIIAILAIVKTDAAYVPLDANYPVDRLQYMLNDTGAQHLLLQEKFKTHFSTLNIGKTYLEDDVSRFNTEDRQHRAKSKDLAYVMYTSGSTGLPKGIEICHQSIARLVRNSNYIDLNETQIFLQYAPISFDAATLEIWGPLLNGGSLVLAPPGHLEMEQLAELIDQENIDTMWLTAALFHYLAEYHLEAFANIKQLLAGGDVLSPDLVRKVLAAYPGIKITNGYGPTENTTFTCCFSMTKPEQVGRSVSIGRPIANTQVYLLDQHLKPVAIGMPGELYTAGDGVARAYLNKPALTEQVFLPNPYAEEFGHGKVLYKTGDLARYLPRGDIEYLGRIDQQVKIRGYRIELGEIENQLKKIKPIREVAVIARQDSTGNKKLVAYLVAEENSKENIEGANNEAIKQVLKANLPEYMLPSAFVWLEKLPITENGKLDRKALPVPDFELSRTSQHIAPRNETETKLQQVWADVLGINNISVFDNYFELGGDSILSIQIVSRAKKQGLKINSRQLFELQTIAALAEHAETQQAVVAEQGFVSKSVVLTPIQQWFFEQNFAHENQWNMSVLLRLNLDLAPMLSKENTFTEVEKVLQAASVELIKQHDILRSVFKTDGMQLSHGYVEANFSNTTLSQVFGGYKLESLADLPKLVSDIQQSLDLEKGPLFKIALIKISNEYRVFISAHHLLVDGVSWRILLEDFNTLLLQFSQNDLLIKEHNAQGQLTGLLGEKTTSFAEWSQVLFEYARSDSVLAQMEYWNSLPFEKVMPLSENSACAEAMIGHEKNYSVAETESIETRLSVEHTRQLLLEANKAYRTEINDLLITALAITLNEWQQQTCCLINLEGHGREHISDAVDVSRTVGWFTTSFPVLLELESAPGGKVDYGNAIKSVKEQLRAIPEKGLGYGLLRCFSQSNPPRQVGSNLQAEISFNYLGQTDSTFDEKSMLLPAVENAGYDRHRDNNQTYLLDIFGIVLNEKLTLGWRYGSTIFDRIAIENLAKRNKQVLEELIEYCLTDGHAGFTPSDFPLANLNQQSLDTIVALHPDIEDLYPLSPMQQGMLFHARLGSETGVYFEQHIVELKGNLDREAFGLAWASAIKQHEILRTSFVWENFEQPLQLVRKHCDIDIECLDLKTDFNEFLKHDRIRGFDFQQAPLMRIALVKCEKNSLKMVWSFHHILLDGWSVARVIADVFSAYENLVQGRIPEQRFIPKYGNYIAWLEKSDKKVAEQFWTQYLAGFEAMTPLGMCSRVPLQLPENQEVKPIKDFTFESVLKEKIESFCKQHHITSNTLFQAAWAYLLASYSNTQDVVFGITVSGRPPELQGVEDMVGLFINTVPLRVTLEEKQNILGWLHEIQQRQTQVRAFESTPLYEIQRCSEITADSPLFNSLLVFENYPVNDVLKTRSMSVEFSNISSVEQTNFPLTVVIMPGEKLKLRLAYEASSFTEVVIERLFNQFSQVLKNIVAKPYDALSGLTAIAAKERNKIVYDWNNTDVNADLNTPVIQEFENSVEKFPTKKAVVDHNAEYSLTELNKKANKIARYLQENGVSKGDFVAILSKSSVDMVAAIIGIVKTGAAHITIDLRYPADRIKHILQDAGVKALVTEDSWQEKLTDFNQIILNLEDSDEKLKGFSEDNLHIKINKNDVAYGIYTSGATGEPKGVLIQHQALKNLCNWHNRNFAITENDNISLIASEGSNASILEMWPGLAKGACINIADNDIRIDPQSLADWLTEKQINVSFLPTTIAENMLKNNVNFPECFRALLIGGERLAIWPDKNLRFKIYNQYGPPEATVVSTSVELNDLQAVGLPPIGKPIDNHKAYVLDKHLSPVPIGMPGELFIGGKGLAWGYLNKEELAEEKFIKNPFVKGTEERLYRTGDLVRYEEDGNLKLVARINQSPASDRNITSSQVKIRGFRIELGEIESALSKQVLVNKAIARAIEYNGQNYLVAYVLPEKITSDELAIDNLSLSRELKLALEEVLPDYMVPSAIIFLDAVPLTANGEIDYKQLPEVDFQKIQLAEYVEPRSETEASLADIWQVMLGMDRVGIYDDFFELGGHSILVTKLSSRIKEKFDINLPLKTLFEMSTVAAQAELIETLKWQDNELTVDEDDEYEEGTL